MESIHPLKRYRDQQSPKLTQGQLAGMLGVSKGSVSRWEAGERKIDVDLLPKVAATTGISTAELRPDLADMLAPPLAPQAGAAE
jgi:transcriptional regulator with XRE-family HTH domain